MTPTINRLHSALLEAMEVVDTLEKESLNEELLGKFKQLKKRVEWQALYGANHTPASLRKRAQQWLQEIS